MKRNIYIYIFMLEINMTFTSAERFKGVFWRLYFKFATRTRQITSNHRISNIPMFYFIHTYYVIIAFTIPLNLSHPYEETVLLYCIVLCGTFCTQYIHAVHVTHTIQCSTTHATQFQSRWRRVYLNPPARHYHVMTANRPFMLPTIGNYCVKL